MVGSKGINRPSDCKDYLVNVNRIRGEIHSMRSIEEITLL